MADFTLLYYTPHVPFDFCKNCKSVNEFLRFLISQSDVIFLLNFYSHFSDQVEPTKIFLKD